MPGKGGCAQLQTDIEVFEVFFERHHAAVFGYLWRMTGEEQTANDLTQETFLRAWQHYSAVSTYDVPCAWLFRVATHLALNHARRLVRRNHIQYAASLGNENPETISTPDQTEQVANREIISRILTSLPARERSALVLHVLHGLSCAELADVLHISLAAAKIALWRGRERFRREYLRKEGGV